MWELFRLPAFIGAFLCAGAVLGLILRRTKLVRLDAARGHSTYGGVMLLTGLAAGAFGGFILMVLVFDWDGGRTLSPDWPIGAVVALVLIAAGLAFVWIWARTRWVWDADGVSYISGKRATRIRWAAIDTLKQFSWHSWRVTGEGREVTWIRYMIGFEVLNQALKQHRPDLIPGR
jgi:hypothetical protein